MLSRMMAESGAERVALLLLEEGRQGPVLRVLSLARGEETPQLLGTIVFPEGAAGYEPVAESAVEMLAKAGWPAKAAAETAGSPWYRKWWVWTLLGAAAAGVAVGIRGWRGGGGSATPTGTGGG